MTQRLNLNIFSITAVLVFIYLAIRSITVPISHDEAATFFHYIQSGKFIPYFTLWDANNHFLNSLLVYPLYKIFGSALFWLRLPNLLFFPIYAIFAYKLTKGIRVNLLQLLTSIALITAPFLIEFFAQTRGYGLSFALLMGVLYFLHKFLNSKRPSYQFLTWVFAALALMANMSLMNTFLILLVGIGIFIATKVRGPFMKMNWIYYVVLGVIPFIAATKFALDMKEMRLLYYGLGDGLVPVTVKSLLRFGFSTESMPLAWTVAGVGLIASVTLIVSYIRKSFNKSSPGILASILLLGNAIGAILLNYLMDVNFPEDRIALYFLPLFIITFGYFIDFIANRAPVLKWIGIVLIAFPISLILQLNLNRTIQWEIYPVSDKLYEFFKTEQLKTDTPLMISGDRLLEMSWGYHNVRSDKMMTPFAHDGRDTLHFSDFVMCHPINCIKYGPEYKLVFEDASNMKIYQRQTDLILSEIYSLDSVIHVKGNSEYMNIIDLEADSLIHNADILELEITFKSDVKPLNMDLIITSSNATNNKLFYDFIPIKWIRGEWNGDKLTMRRPVSIPTSSERLVVYIWNIEGAAYEMTVNSAKLYKADTHERR